MRRDREQSHLTEEETLEARGLVQKLNMFHENSMNPGVCTPDIEMSADDFTQKGSRDYLDRPRGYQVSNTGSKADLQRTPPKSKVSRGRGGKKSQGANNSARQGSGNFSGELKDLNYRIKSIDHIIAQRREELRSDALLVEGYQLDSLKQEIGVDSSWQLSDIESQIRVANETIIRLRSKLTLTRRNGDIG